MQLETPELILLYSSCSRNSLQQKFLFIRDCKVHWSQKKLTIIIEEGVSIG